METLPTCDHTWLDVTTYADSAAGNQAEHCIHCGKNQTTSLKYQEPAMSTPLLETNPTEYYERLKQWATSLGLNTENIRREPATLIRTIGGCLYKHNQYVRRPNGELVPDLKREEAVYDTIHTPITFQQAKEAHELELVNEY